MLCIFHATYSSKKLCENWLVSVVQIVTGFANDGEHPCLTAFGRSWSCHVCLLFILLLLNIFVFLPFTGVNWAQTCSNVAWKRWWAGPSPAPAAGNSQFPCRHCIIICSSRYTQNCRMPIVHLCPIYRAKTFQDDIKMDCWSKTCTLCESQPVPMQTLTSQCCRYP